MKISVSTLRKAIRKVLLEHMTPADEAEYELAYKIAEKLMYTPHYDDQRVADEMSGGRYSTDPNFKLLVDDLYEKLENEAWGP